MITNKMRTNVKLAKLFYKYLDEPKDNKEEAASAPEPETTAKPEVKDYESYPPYNFSWFIENKVAAMGWPQTVENLNYLADVGVDHLITLSPERRPPILECKKKLKWSEIRIKEFGTPNLKQILKFIEICERAEIRGEVIGVHCRHGRGRTGTMLACYLVHFRDMAPERAVLTVRVQRPGSCETYEQEKIVCHYHDCMRGTISKPDYRLVEDKLYFDYSMKYNYSDDEESTKSDDENLKELADLKIEEKQVVETLQLKKRKKSKAMVINHHIYF
ncbi:dual specificity protein phosphatase 23-like [Ostrinia nubilalis]|uniref:dual specificity protein phosphatase 23-like n=1 Tax=Ostrinia furnacalis TaxID=93504 RepID=UPI00103F4BFB|nr:dual specificity protein phosphatase 23-like [Ostrinia furnacalis]XP_028172509.1 dual specificity protein phosphatase 23-like [Ostrinia furnacalis]